jgi:DNA-binding GntR family transcriptional regulator
MLDVVPLTSEKLTDQTYRILKAKILDRSFSPGQRLDLLELEQKLGVSRTPIKEALGRLAVEGLIRIEPRKGTFVAQPSRREIHEYLEVRRMIEIYAAEHIVGRTTPEELAHLRRLLQEVENLYDPAGDRWSDAMLFLDKNRAIHTYLISLVGNAKLVEVYQQLRFHEQMAFINYLTTDPRGGPTIKEHREIYAALSEGNREKLVDALTRHLDAAEQQILSHLD